MPTRKPEFALLYQGTNITADVADFLTDITYTDRLEGGSDDLSIRLQNPDLRWMDSWLTDEGDTVSLELGYAGEAKLGPVLFEVDEPEWSGSASQGDHFTLKGLATPVTKSLRQRNTQAYEETTLLAIAQQIAEKHSLEMIGADSIPKINIKRQTQKEQTDLAFLRKLAAEYGVSFKIESTTKLVFFREEDLEQAEPVLTLYRSVDDAPSSDSRDVLASYNIKRKAGGTYKAATVSYQDGETGEFVEVTIDTDGAEIPKSDDEEGATKTQDVLKVRERCETKGQAEVKARAALRRANSSRLTITGGLEGNPVLSAGVVIEVKGFYRLNGKFLVDQVGHKLSTQSGYRCNFEARKIGAVSTDEAA